MKDDDKRMKDYLDGLLAPENKEKTDGHGMELQENRPPYRLAPPEKEFTFEEWQAVIRKHYPALLRPAELCASVFAQLLIADIRNPFGLILVGEAGCGKTTTLNFFKDLPEIVYMTDDATPASWISQSPDRSKKELLKVHLLTKILHKAFILRDMAPMLKGGPAALDKTVGILTRLLDGEGYRREGGVHGSLGVSGNCLFMFLAASLPFEDKVFDVMGSAGNRLVFHYMGGNPPSAEDLMEQVFSNNKAIRDEACAYATAQFIRTFWPSNNKFIEWETGNDSKELIQIITKCALLVRRLRATVKITFDRDTYSLTNTTPNCLFTDLLPLLPLSWYTRNLFVLRRLLWLSLVFRMFLRIPRNCQY